MTPNAIMFRWQSEEGVKSWLRRWQSRRRLGKVIGRVNKTRKKPPAWQGHLADIEVLAVRPAHFGVVEWNGKPEFIGRIQRSDGKRGLFAFTQGGTVGAPFEVAGAAIAFARFE